MKKRSMFPIIVSALLGGLTLTSCNPQQETQQVVSLSSISVNTSVSKTSYNVGDSFERPTVVANYSDGSTKSVQDSCTFNGFDSTTAGSKTITVSFTEDGVTKTTTYTITVVQNEDILQSIRVVNPKTEYNVGDNFEKPQVIATFADAGDVDVTSDATCTGFNSSTAGNLTINVSYTYGEVTETTTYNVTITGLSTRVKFAIFADIQLCAKEADGSAKNANFGNTANAPIALKNHLQYIKDNNIDVVLMNGDITNQANSYYYAYFNEIATGVFGADKTAWPEFVMNMGNHEWWAGTTEKDPRTGSTLPDGAINAVELFKNNARIESENLVKRSEVKYASNRDTTLPSYYKVINGVPFMVISANSSAGDISEELEAELQTWLNEIKQLETVKAGGPIFVEYHYALSTSMTHGQGSVQQATTVEELFKDVPNAIVFTGDTHYPGNNERSINQVDFTTINLGSSSYSRMVDESAVIANDFDNVTNGHKSGKGEIAQGNVGYQDTYTPNFQVVEVFENNTTNIKRFMSTDTGARKVAEDWNIPATKSKSDFIYTNARFQNKQAAKNLYGKEGVSWENGDTVTFGIDEETKQMTVHFKDPVEHHFVEHYEIKVNGTPHYFVSNYAKYPESRVDNYFVVENVPVASSYTVEVTAYDFYDNPSLNKLTSTNSDASKTIEPLDYYFVDQNYNYSDIDTRNNFVDVAEGSNCSNEFYYKGIQVYKYGAILGNLISVEYPKTSEYVSLESGEGSKPTVTCDVKNLGEGNLNIGITVVDKSGKWWTDFGREIQQTVTGKDWTTLTWDLSTLFGITNKDNIKQVSLKANSSNATDQGYEMNFLLDNIDVTNGGNIPTPPSERGTEFTAGNDLVIDLEQPVANTGKIVVDLKLDTSNTTGKVAISLVDSTSQDWCNYYGYYSFFSNGTMENVTTGVSISHLDDGFFRVTFNMPEMVKIHATDLPETVDTVFVRGSWTEINGRIDVNPKGGNVIRGNRFTKGNDFTVDLPSNVPLTDNLVIDFKFDEVGDSNKISIMLGQGWNQYFGYFTIVSTGVFGPYDGVTVNQLDDGYMRVTFDLDVITKVSDKPAPNEYINLVYVRDIWAEASGYIDINPTQGNIVRGDSYTAGQHYDKSIPETPIATGTVVVDFKFTTGPETRISIMIGDGWSNYFGYYRIHGDGTSTKTYPGVNVRLLEDGYYRITFTLSELNEKNGDTVLPTEKVNMVYIRGADWSDACGYVVVNPQI